MVDESDCRRRMGKLKSFVGMSPMDFRTHGLLVCTDTRIYLVVMSPNVDIVEAAG